jgi:hypothetical protein
MNQLVLPVVAGNLPAGLCPATYQQLLQAIAAALSVTFPESFSGVYASATPPSDTTQVWVQLDSLGRYVRTYTYAQGAWLSPHAALPGDCKFIITIPPDFTTYDGGDANAIGPQSGPMWQLPLDSNGNAILAAQFPIGAGTLPSGAILTVGNTGGEDLHVLVTPEMPFHNHSLVFDSGQIAGGAGYTLFIEKATGTVDAPTLPVNGGLTTTGDSGGSSSNANNAANGHNTMPPYYVGTWIQRTSRLYYAAS